MDFMAYAFDKADALPRRLEVIAAHRAFLKDAPERFGITVRLSGPLKSDDQTRMIGSFFLLDAPDRAAIQAMFAQDPLVAADVWEGLTITAVEIRKNAMGER